MKLFIIFSLILLYTTGFAEATVMSEVELSEISFKDKTADWIELKINSQVNEPLQIKDDKLITTIQPKNTEGKKFFLIHLKTGLTGTTEQITIESTDGKILDAVCWQNSSPTKSEQKDMEKLIQKNAWDGPCIDSEKVKTNQSIAKIGSSWTIFPHPTPEKENIIVNSPPLAVITLQNSKVTPKNSVIKTQLPFSVNLDGSKSSDPDGDTLTYKWIFPDNKITEGKNPKSYKFTKSGNYEISLTVTDLAGKSDTKKLKIQILPKQNETLQSVLTKTKDPTEKTIPPKNFPIWQIGLMTLAIVGILALVVLTKSPSQPSHYK